MTQGFTLSCAIPPFQGFIADPEHSSETSTACSLLMSFLLTIAHSWRSIISIPRSQQSSVPVLKGRDNKAQGETLGFRTNETKP